MNNAWRRATRIVRANLSTGLRRLPSVSNTNERKCRKASYGRRLKRLIRQAG